MRSIVSWSSSSGKLNALAREGYVMSSCASHSGKTRRRREVSRCAYMGRSCAGGCHQHALDLAVSMGDSPMPPLVTTKS